MYWGASIMWFVDAIFEYAELHAAYFTPDPMDMLNDLFLGLSVVAFGSDHMVGDFIDPRT